MVREGHRVKIYKISGKELFFTSHRSNLGFFFQEPQEQTYLPPPRTLIMDFTMTHIRFGRSNLHPIVQHTYTRRSDGAPECDGALTSHDSGQG